MSEVNKLYLTIGRPSCTDGRKVISMEVRDASSRLTVFRAEWATSDFMEALTGLYEVPSQSVSFLPTDRRELLGKRKEIMSLQCPKASGYGSERDGEQRRLIGKDMTARGLDSEWMVWDDGCRSQQHGEMHDYSVCRYVEDE